MSKKTPRRVSSRDIHEKTHKRRLEKSFRHPSGSFKRAKLERLKIEDLELDLKEDSEPDAQNNPNLPNL